MWVALVVETGPQLTDSKESGTSVPQLLGTAFGQNKNELAVDFPTEPPEGMQSHQYLDFSLLRS